MRIRQLEILSVVVIAMVALCALAPPAILGWAALEPSGFQQYVAPVAQDIDLAATLFGIATAIIFARWIYVAGTNAIALGHDDLDFTPAARIWWFAVPIANLFKPFEAMRELWNASHGELQYDRGSPLVTLWWASWLGSRLTTSFAAIVTGADPMVGTDLLWWIDAAVNFAACVAAILLVRRITVAQHRPTSGELAAVFD